MHTVTSVNAERQIEMERGKGGRQKGRELESERGGWGR